MNIWVFKIFYVVMYYFFWGGLHLGMGACHFLVFVPSLTWSLGSGCNWHGLLEKESSWIWKADATMMSPYSNLLLFIHYEIILETCLISYNKQAPSKWVTGKRIVLSTCWWLKDISDCWVQSKVDILFILHYIMWIFKCPPCLTGLSFLTQLKINCTKWCKKVQCDNCSLQNACF